MRREALHRLAALTVPPARHDAFVPADLLPDDLTCRAGLALDNARLYQRQRKIAETMQRHLLPVLPGLEMTALRTRSGCLIRGR